MTFYQFVTTAEVINTSLTRYIYIIEAKHALMVYDVLRIGTMCAEPYQLCYLRSV